MSDHDSQELQDLFDSIAEKTTPPETEQLVKAAGPSEGPSIHLADAPSNIYKSIGHLVRKLHDALREIGQDSLIFKADEMLPQSRERLTFIGDLMEKSATQCVQITEREMPRLELSIEKLKVNKSGWDKVVSGHSNLQEFKTLAHATPALLHETIEDQKIVKNALMEVLMAQGFQDLAGQTLGKVVAQVAGFERELLELLAVAAVDNDEREKLSEFLEGPQYKKTEDAVHNQQEVDDLLKDLGF